jgi:hypothetical protein
MQQQIGEIQHEIRRNSPNGNLPELFGTEKRLGKTVRGKYTQGLTVWVLSSNKDWIVAEVRI